MVDLPPLAIVQARMGSTRLPGKMMLPLANHPLIWHAWHRSVAAFGETNVVVAIPGTPENNVLKEYIHNVGGAVFTWDGPEEDVLGRFWHCAHAYRWHPDSVICRVTPDDPLKEPGLMREVALGLRHPVEQSCECVTLQTLDLMHEYATDPQDREHLSRIFSPVPPPPPLPGIWTVDTEADYEAMRAKMEGG